MKCCREEVRPIAVGQQVGKKRVGTYACDTCKTEYVQRTELIATKEFENEIKRLERLRDDSDSEVRRLSDYKTAEILNRTNTRYEPTKDRMKRLGPVTPETPGL